MADIRLQHERICGRCPGQDREGGRVLRYRRVVSVVAHSPTSAPIAPQATFKCTSAGTVTGILFWLEAELVKGVSSRLSLCLSLLLSALFY